jgi:hypothetical protein
MSDHTEGLVRVVWYGSGGELDRSEPLDPAEAAAWLAERMLEASALYAGDTFKVEACE